MPPRIHLMTCHSRPFPPPIALPSQFYHSLPFTTIPCGGCNQSSPSLVHPSHLTRWLHTWPLLFPCPYPRSARRRPSSTPMKLAAASAARPSPGANAGFREFAPSSAKGKVVTGLTALVLTAAMVIPDVAEAVQPEVLPSLKNFLLSILAGGVVLGVIVGAVICVANFDPVKRS